MAEADILAYLPTVRYLAFKIWRRGIRLFDLEELEAVGRLALCLAQAQYVGWGFRMTFRLDPTLGKVNLSLDGVPVVTNLDLSTGLFDSLAPNVNLIANDPSFPGLPASVTVTMLNVPLDQHRVKVQGNGFAANGTGIAFVYPRLEYIY